jgi:hypothetical protein
MMSLGPIPAAAKKRSGREVVSGTGNWKWNGSGKWEDRSEGKTKNGSVCTKFLQF